MKKFSKIILIIFILIGCDDSHNTNTEEMENALSEMYWTIQSGSVSNDVIYDITIDKNDSIYLSGYTQGSLTGSSNIGNKDVILIKHSKNGKIDWSKQIGTVSNDEGKGIKYDSQNNIYVFGTTYSSLDGNTHAGLSDIFLLKYNESGLKQWSSQLGTVNIDQAFSLFIDSSDNIYLTGRTNGDLVSNSNRDNKSDYFIIKYDNSGNRISSNQFGVLKDDISFDLINDNTGNIYVSGSTSNTLDNESHIGGKDIFLVKFDSSLNRLWTKTIGTSNDEEAYSIAMDSLGNSYVVGYTRGALDGNSRLGVINDKDIFIIKYDEDGNKEWSLQDGTSSEDVAYNVAVDSSDYIYITGKTCSDYNGNSHKGDCDYFLKKINSSGQLIWTRQGGTSYLDISLGIDFDSLDNIYIIGYTFGSIDGKNKLGGSDYFVVKYNKDGYKQ